MSVPPTGVSVVPGRALAVASAVERNCLGLPPALFPGFSRLIRLGSFLLLWCLATTPGWAVVVFGTGDPSHNSAEPNGDLVGSGWKLQGQWGREGRFLGTPVAPKFFLTAAHVGGEIGDAFVFQGTNYLTSALFDDPETDLRLWRICGEFPAYATLQRETNEVGQPMIAFGRGTQRGEPVEVLIGNAKRTVQGWRWGAPDRVMRWGTNVVTAVVEGNALFGMNGIGPLIQADFDRSAGYDECHLSNGDSGGAVFVWGEAGWRLAGINYAVDGPYRLTPAGDSFFAFLFDQDGLYVDNGADWVLFPDGPDDAPSSFYATQVSARMAWIDSVLLLPLPPDDQPRIQYAPEVRGPYRDDPTAEWDAEAQTIVSTGNEDARFYRLEACRAIRIASVESWGEGVRIGYEWAP